MTQGLIKRMRFQHMQPIEAFLKRRIERRHVRVTARRLQIERLHHQIVVAKLVITRIANLTERHRLVCNPVAIERLGFAQRRQLPQRLVATPQPQQPAHQIAAYERHLRRIGNRRTQQRQRFLRAVHLIQQHAKRALQRAVTRQTLQSLTQHPLGLRLLLGAPQQIGAAYAQMKGVRLPLHRRLVVARECLTRAAHPAHVRQRILQSEILRPALHAISEQRFRFGISGLPQKRHAPIKPEHRLDNPARHQLIVDRQSFAIAPQPPKNESAAMQRHGVVRITRYRLIRRGQRLLQALLRAQHARQQFECLCARRLLRQRPGDVFRCAQIAARQRRTRLLDCLGAHDSASI